MKYMFETKPSGNEDFASGRVLYNARGTTAFPVRLASEIMQRCFLHLEGKGHDEPYSVYDPCCGGAYMLTVVGLLHGHRMKRSVASDVNSEVLGIAEKNLSLLSADGMSGARRSWRSCWSNTISPLIARRWTVSRSWPRSYRNPT